MVEPQSGHNPATVTEVGFAPTPREALIPSSKVITINKSKLPRRRSTLLHSRSELVILKLFSPGSSEASSDLVHYIMYEWAAKVTNITFNISFPLLITKLGDSSLGIGQGKILFSYVTIIVAILTSISFLTVTSVLDYGLMKRKAFFRFALISSIVLILFIFCFEQGAVYFACVLVILARVSYSIASISYDALLDAISCDRDPHSVSARSYVTGYVGMLAFILTIAPILALIYTYGTRDLLWLEGIVPTVLSGVW